MKTRSASHTSRTRSRAFQGMSSPWSGPLGVTMGASGAASLMSVLDFYCAASSSRTTRLTVVPSAWPRRSAVSRFMTGPMPF